VSAPRLRWALTSLYRERRDESLSLSRKAERAIGRHLVTRWSFAAATVAFAGVVATFGWMAGLSAASGGDSAGSPAPLGIAIPAVAHVPVLGGPPYAHRWGDFECGDTAPAPFPAAPEQRLSISLTRSGVGDLATASLTWTAPEEEHIGRSEPVIGMGVLEVLVARDGVIVGMLIIQDAALGWQLHGHTSTVAGHATLSAGQFYCIGVDDLSGAYLYHEVELGPGSYEAVAVSRLFATPESVALFQALTDTRFTTVDERARQGGVDYAPGSRGCEALQTQYVTVRACLPDVIPTASLDEDTETVRMLYDASALPQEFDVTLVSEPLTMVID
jgi:hypothetical protein